MVFYAVKPKTRSVFMTLSNIFSTVIREKGESQNGCFKKTEHAKFSIKQPFLTP